jgi:hypothetical protein
MKQVRCTVAIAAAGALIGGGTAQAQWTGSFVDMGVSYTLTDLTVGSSTTHRYTLAMDTRGYSGPAGAYLDSVNIKAWDVGSFSGFSLTSAPAGSGWTPTKGPISSGSIGTTGCGGSGAGYACAEAIIKGVFDVALGAPYSFSFDVTAASAAAFRTSIDGVHVGAGYANALGRGAGYGITSVEMTTPIPEPETYAMLLAGLGLLSLVVWRRQRSMLAAA